MRSPESASAPTRISLDPSEVAYEADTFFFFFAFLSRFTVKVSGAPSVAVAPSTLSFAFFASAFEASVKAAATMSPGQEPP